ncbi:hypothetical protein TWF751_003201 [Orbilia oligospora]|nr:hypothetical protein TWF751_003201 [Orbilia oligospora]
MPALYAQINLTAFETASAQPELNHSIKGIQTVSVSQETSHHPLQAIAFRQPFKLETVFTYTQPNLKFSVKPELNAPPSPEENPTDVFSFTQSGSGFAVPPPAPPAPTKSFSDLRYIDDFPSDWQEELPTGYIQRAGKLEATHIKAAPDASKKSVKAIGGWEVLTSFEPETDIENFLILAEEEEENGKVDITAFEVKDNIATRKEWKPVTQFEDELDISKFVQEELGNREPKESKPEGTEEAKPAPKKETPLLTYPKIEALLPSKDNIIVYTRQTDGRRHLAKFERLVAEAYPGAKDSDRWHLFIKTIQPDNKQPIAIDSPGGWLIGFSKTDAWKSGRLTYQHLKAAFLDRWAGRGRRDTDSPTERRMIEGPSSPESEASYHSGPTKTTIEIDHSNKQKNQIVVSFPDRIKRRKSFGGGGNLSRPRHPGGYPNDSMESPYSSDYYTRSPSPSDIDGPPPPSLPQPKQLQPKEVVVVVNEERALTRVEPPTAPPAAAALAAPLRSRLLEGRVCAITGASKGIGRAIAMGFAREGAHIIAHYWGSSADSTNDEIVSLAVDIRAAGQGCTLLFGDISDPKTSEMIVKKAVDAYGRLDVLVTCAGMAGLDPMDMTPEDFARFSAVNYEGTYHLLRLAANQMASQNVDLKPEDPRPDYSVICVSSSNPSEIGNHNTPAKAGMAALAHSSALSLGSRGIRCNTILAANIERSAEPLEGTAEERRKILERMIPLRRVGRPDDIVGPAVFLASAMSRYLTGTTVTVDGGFAGSF